MNERVSERVVVETTDRPLLPAALRRISWGAVFAGVVVALATQLLLGLLGVGIGSSMVDLSNRDTPTKALAYGAPIWFALSSIAALFAGGWVAGRLAGVPQLEALLHGVLTWCVATLLGFYLLGSAVGSFIGGTFRAVGQGIGAITQGVAQAAPNAAGAAQAGGADWEDIRREARGLLRQAAGPGAEKEVGKSARAAAEDPLKADWELNHLLERLFTRGGDDANPADKQALVNVLVNRYGKSEAEAEKIVDKWEEAYKQAKQRAREAGDKVASGVARTALWGTLALLLGLGSAAAGGYTSQDDRRLVRTTERVTI